MPLLSYFLCFHPQIFHPIPSTFYPESFPFLDAVFPTKLCCRCSALKYYYYYFLEVLNKKSIIVLQRNIRRQTDRRTYRIIRYYPLDGTTKHIECPQQMTRRNCSSCLQLMAHEAFFGGAPSILVYLQIYINRKCCLLLRPAIVKQKANNHNSHVLQFFKI